MMALNYIKRPLGLLVDESRALEGIHFSKNQKDISEAVGVKMIEVVVFYKVGITE